MQTASEVVYTALRSLGIKVIFGNPRSTDLDLMKAMPADFTSVLGLHERVVAGMAIGYAIGSRNAAFVAFDCIANAGSGLSAIIDAYYCHAPVVLAVGKQELEWHSVESFATRRALEVFTPYVKGAYEPRRPEDVPAAIISGHQFAMQPPMGPVLITLPLADWNIRCEQPVIHKVNSVGTPDIAMLDSLIRVLDSSSKIVLVVGSQVEEDDAWHHVVALAERLNADVYEEPKASRWSFPRRHPLFRGSLYPAQQPLSDQLTEYDTILVIGAPVFLYYAYVLGTTIKPGTRLFQITNSPADASSALMGTSMVGNIAGAAQYISGRVKPVRTDKICDRPEPPELAPEYPMTPKYVFNVLGRAMPSNTIIAEEVPSSMDELYRQIFPNEPSSFYSSRSGIWGFAMPLAVGLQLGCPERRVVCPVGDGSAQYSIQSLWSAARHNARVIFLLLRNGDYSTLRGFRDSTMPGSKVHGMEIPNIDAVKIAQGYGLPARTVDRPEYLSPTLREAFALEGPCLISVNVQSGGQKCLGLDLSMNPPGYV
jgi:benzoylformate decarboxylase